MSSNVHIKHYRGGVLVEERAVHNVLTYAGRRWLNKLISCVAYGASPIPERDDRIKYMGLGIGGINRVHYASLDAAYPAGYAALKYPPSFTSVGSSSGADYNQRTYLAPRIDSLEIPVRFSGDVSEPWKVGDEWLRAGWCATHRSDRDMTLNVQLSGGAGDLEVAALGDNVPLSEAALFTSAADVGDPFNNPLADADYMGRAVAYVNFPMLLFGVDSVIDLSWSVRFT